MEGIMSDKIERFNREIRGVLGSFRKAGLEPSFPKLEEPPATAPHAPLVLAKFEVMAVTRRKGFVPIVDAQGNPARNCNGHFDLELGETVTVELLHVHCDSGSPDRPPDANHENTRSWLAVPKGEIEIQVADPRAVAAFAVGRHYWVELRACEGECA
jgi:hypothetical protein